MTFAPIAPEIEAVAKTIVDAGFRVRAALGPGLLESAYEHCLAYELESRGCLVGRPLAVPIVYGTVNSTRATGWISRLPERSWQK